MRVALAGITVEATEFGELAPLTSQHTGRLIRRAELGFRARAGDSDRINEALNSKAPVEISATDSRIQGRWTAKLRTSSYLDDSALRHFSVSLAETESFEIAELAVGSFRFTPYEYEEEFSGDELRVRARVQVPPSTHDSLVRSFAEDEQLTVIRRGISDEPRTMRWGRKMLWSSHAEAVKQELILVDMRAADDVPPRAGLTLFEPEMSYLIDSAAYTTQLFQTLWERLKTKGIFTEEEIADLRAEADRRTDAMTRHGFYQVSDLDKFD